MLNFYVSYYYIPTIIYISYNFIDGASVPEVVVESAGKQQAIVIPEKASSFKVHPGRLCQDQCFYCGGKFGLYDTPCHIAAMKSVERQKKILASKFLKFNYVFYGYYVIYPIFQ